MLVMGRNCGLDSSPFATIIPASTAYSRERVYLLIAQVVAMPTRAEWRPMVSTRVSDGTSLSSESR